MWYLLRGDCTIMSGSIDELNREKETILLCEGEGYILFDSGYF